MDVFNLADAPSFITKDGSEIRELLGPRNSGLANQSLAEARLPAGQATTPHWHESTEEIYYIQTGQARMRVGDETRHVRAGDAIAIPPGQLHQIVNTGRQTLIFLCCCAPPYEHDDTVLVEGAAKPRRGRP
jgi:mannose-6-phosphate isomerase-like protein (cupin superfamily)